MMVLNGVDVGDPREYDLVPAAKAAELVGDKRPDTDPEIAAQVFFINGNGCPEGRLADCFAVLVAVVVVNGKAFEGLLAQLLAEVGVVVGGVGSEGALEPDLAVGDTGGFKLRGVGTIS